MLLIKPLQRFFRLESASGILLLLATFAALIAQNTAASTAYNAFLNLPIEINLGLLEIAKPLLLWVNDGLMAIFFLLVGLELKREILQGQLSNPAHIALPVVAAIGGMLLPAGIYTAINWGDAFAMRGWAIPSATDIAFALGVLGLLGSRVPRALKLFLLTLAIVDDLGAIIIIAAFYTDSLSMQALLVAGVAVCALYVLNIWRVLSLTLYFAVGLVLWVAVLESGIHATLAGVVLAMFIPIRTNEKDRTPPLVKVEHALLPFVAYGILPLFAFANTGISLQGFTFATLLQPVPLGIMAGLFVGKQIGIFGFSWLAVKLGLASLTDNVRWLELYAVSILAGIGFTMSLFISSLASGDWANLQARRQVK